MKLKCQCPYCHCTNEYEESEETSVEIHPLPDESVIDTEQDIRYLESQTHLAICPSCANGQHVVFEF